MFVKNTLYPGKNIIILLKYILNVLINVYEYFKYITINKKKLKTTFKFFLTLRLYFLLTKRPSCKFCSTCVTK